MDQERIDELVRKSVNMCAISQLLGKESMSVKMRVIDNPRSKYSYHLQVLLNFIENWSEDIREGNKKKKEQH